MERDFKVKKEPVIRDRDTTSTCSDCRVGWAAVAWKEVNRLYAHIAYFRVFVSAYKSCR
jgi:hypothetical protein